METFLLIEAILVSLLALPLGVLAVRARGRDAPAADSGPFKRIPTDLLIYWGAVISVAALTLLAAWFFFWFRELNRHNLPLTLGPYPFNYAGVTVLALEVILLLTPVVLALAYLLGQRESLLRAFGVLLLFGLAVVMLAAITLFLAFVAPALTMAFLMLGIWLLGLFGAYYIAWWGRSQNRMVLMGSWTGCYLLVGLVAFIIGRLGLWFIVLPAILGFIVALYALSGLVLPTANGQERWQALRTLLTFAMGTNFSYYFIEDWQKRENYIDPLPEPRVTGNAFRKYFAGPGVVLTDANHLAVLWDGFKYRVAPPGLTFTEPYEQLYAAVDLRPQLRVTTIDAETSDGVVTNTLIFAPHRIAAGGRQAALGASYPYDEDAVLRAVCDNAYIEHHFDRKDNLADEKLESKQWHELAVMFAAPILKSLMLRRTCNELHEPGTTRVEIATEFVRRLREQLADVGIELIGGGLSNITVPAAVVEQRIESWAAKWKRQIEIELGEEEAEITKMLDPIWAKAQLDIYAELAAILRDAGDQAPEVIAFQLVDALAASPMEEKNVQDVPKFMWSFMRRGHAAGASRSAGRG